MRHGKAAMQNGPVGVDFARPLTEEGCQEVAMVGRYCQKLSVHPQLVIASTAKRTQMTAQQFTSVYETAIETRPEAALYNAGLADLLKVLHDIDDQYQHVLLIGHNPGVTELTQYLTNTSLPSLTAGSLYQLRFNASSWSDLTKQGGQTVLFLSPEFLKGA